MFNYLERNKVVLVYLPLIFYWLLLFILTSLPSQSVPSVGVNDKLEHFAAFFGLSFLLYLALSLQKKSPLVRKNAFLFTLIIASFYGLLDELHQLIIPGRSCELIDLTADILGAILGVVFFKIVFLKLFKREELPA
ncbi:MAG: VanZ family protein [Ignavibacteriaceae bacterium]|nr:VanZ family protein [Ignavibacteriaceae bacterium]